MQDVADKCNKGPGSTPLSSDLGSKTYGDYAGQALEYRGLERPHRRCLWWHATAAVIHAEREGWQAPGQVQVPDSSSPGTYHATLELFWDRMPANSQESDRDADE